MKEIDLLNDLLFLLLNSKQEALDQLKQRIKNVYKINLIKDFDCHSEINNELQWLWLNEKEQTGLYVNVNLNETPKPTLYIKPFDRYKYKLWEEEYSFRIREINCKVMSEETDFSKMSGDDTLWIRFLRSDFESGNVQYYIDWLNKIHKHGFRNCKNRITLSFDGYDSDMRALWQIPEVISFVKKLDAAFPYWFYYVNKIDAGLTAIFIICRGNNPGKYIEQCFAYMNQVSEMAGLSEQQIMRDSHEISAYLDTHLIFTTVSAN